MGYRLATVPALQAGPNRRWRWVRRLLAEAHEELIGVLAFFKALLIPVCDVCPLFWAP
jgi:hypothetical protein